MTTRRRQARAAHDVTDSGDSDSPQRPMESPRMSSTDRRAVAVNDDRANGNTPHLDPSPFAIYIGDVRAGRGRTPMAEFTNHFGKKVRREFEPRVVDNNGRPYE